MKKKSKKWIIIILLIVAAVGGVFAVNNKIIEVRAAAADVGSVEKIVSESGTVQPVSSALVSSKVSGQIDSVMAREGDEVKEGQRLATYARSVGAADISSLRAQLTGVQAQISQAKSLEERSKKLYEEGALSFEEYNKTVIEREQLETQASSLRYSIEAMSEAAGSGGITAPITGTITSVNIKEGEVVAPGTALMEISNTKEIYVLVNLVSDDADQISLGNTVRIIGENDAILDEQASVGKIYVKAQDVLSDLGIVQKRVPVEINLSLTSPLRLGRDVTAEIITDKKENVIRVPEKATFEMNKEQYVYIIVNEKAKLQKIQLGLRGEDFVEVREGLAEGDLVILSPGQDIGDGVSVSIVAANV